jgi:hypothetical protein
MEILRHIVVFVHLTGFALLFGAWAAQAFGGKRQITGLMNAGLAIAAVAGLVLAAPWGLDHDLNYVKVGVKLVVLLIIGALMGIGQARGRRTGSVPSPLFWSIGVLTLANAAIAVIWR